LNAVIDQAREYSPLALKPQKPWMQTHSGRVFPLLTCGPADVHWPDVIYHLAHANRFAGAAGGYSVAQHSVIVGRLLPPSLKPYGLLHDAEEFAIGDVTQPTSQALKALGMGNALSKLKTRLRDVIHCAAMLPPLCMEDEAKIKRADNIALATEKRDLLAAMPSVVEEDWLHGVAREAPMQEVIRAWPASVAAEMLEVELFNCGVLRNH
jgi:hypothetical protein